MQRTSHIAHGFSLIETIVAIAIVGLLTVGTTTLLNRITVNTREIHNQDIALKITQHQLEILRMGGYDALPTSGSFSNSRLSTLPSGTASHTLSSVNSKTKQVTVSVYWVDTTNTPRSISLTTLISQNAGLP